MERMNIDIVQLDSELSEAKSVLMMKSKELTALKEDNKLLRKQFRESSDLKRREKAPQV